jgi:type I restriction enzyme S subunit
MMAVDSLRETRHINRISPRDIGVLWSAQSYRPDITAAVRKIRSMAWRPLAELCVNPIGPGPHPSFAPTGHPCLKTKNVLGVVVDTNEMDFVDPNNITRWPHYLIESEDLVLNITGSGSIGRIGIYFGNDRPLTNQHLAKLSIAPGTDAAYVCSFLSSWWGERLLEQGVGGSTGQLNLVNEHIRQVPILEPNLLAQRYIGDKVRQVERLRELARRLRSGTTDAFASAGLLGSVANPRRIGRVSSVDVLDRLDALHYRDDLIKNLHAIRRHPTIRLGSTANFSGLADGDHGNPCYGNGPIYVRATELAGDTLQAQTEVRLDSRYAAGVSASVWATSDEVLFSIVGTLGATGILENGVTAVLSRGVAKVRPLTLSKYYVKAFMRTNAFALELLRRSVGTIQRGVYLESLQHLEIPIIEKNVVQIIARSEELADQSLLLAKMLTRAVKVLVENLIEGRISEADLIAAQKALDAGDRSADRKILKALRQSDAPGAKPLITDVDGLYALLDDSEGLDP